MISFFKTVLDREIYVGIVRDVLKKATDKNEISLLILEYHSTP